MIHFFYFHFLVNQTRYFHMLLLTLHLPFRQILQIISKRYKFFRDMNDLFRQFLNTRLLGKGIQIIGIK